LVRERKALDIRALRWALGGRIAGTVMAAATLAVLPERPLGILFALLVLTAVVLSVAGWYVRPRPRTLAAAGVASGFLGTAPPLAGPPTALPFQPRRGSEPRATGRVGPAFRAGPSPARLIAVARLRGDRP